MFEGSFRGISTVILMIPVKLYKKGFFDIEIQAIENKIALKYFFTM